MDDHAKEIAREVASEVLKTIEPRLQMHFENVEELVKVAADGYGATLEKIERELVDLNKKVDTSARDHHLTLVDHNKRIVTLENRR